MNAKLKNKPATPVNNVDSKPKKNIKLEKSINSNTGIASGLNTLLWLIAIALLVIVSTGNLYLAKYIQNNIVLNIIIFVLFCASLGILAFTNQGKKTISFIQDARIELRKVIWPTKAETNQTTLIVIAVTVLISLILWLFDAVIYKVIDFLINLGV